MENILLYDKISEERHSLEKQIRDVTAILSDARLRLWERDRFDAALEFILSDSDLELAVMEVSGSRDIELTKMLRHVKRQLEMMLVADADISPMEYLTPDIRACSLLLRPYTEDQLQQVTRAFMAAYFRSRENRNDSSLLLEGRNGVTAIPYNSIYYIEAREKKVFIRQRYREYSLYETLENIEAGLPDYFRRSHRSFVFNTRYMIGFKLSENTIFLEDGITVPLSRTYKADIKEFINGRRQRIYLSE